MIPFLVLIVINLIILFMIREPENFAEVKKRYKILREHLEKTNNEKFGMLIHPIPLTALRKMSGTVGYNVNKGADITICIDCLLYTSPSPRDGLLSRMPSSA